MSTQRGNSKKGPPKHQNTFAFKHNPKSKLTKKILESPVSGLCKKCYDQILWRKKYRKYKPLSKPACCTYCHNKTVVAAYHAACDSCAKERDVCAKCLKKEEIVSSETTSQDDDLTSQEVDLEGLREREKRSILRNAQKNNKEKGSLSETESIDEDLDEDFDLEDADL